MVKGHYVNKLLFVIQNWSELGELCLVERQSQVPVGDQVGFIPEGVGVLSELWLLDLKSGRWSWREVSSVLQYP